MLLLMKSDNQLQNDVLAELQWDASINASHLGVEVDDGVVTLTGQVDSFLEKWEAERAAQRVMGVRALAVNIHVELPGSAVRSDEDIARTADNVLHWTSAVPKDHVKVLVERGWVTLSGEVPWDYQREAAQQIICNLMGVVGVSNQITLRFPHGPPASGGDD